jgi:hypothetical protein
MFTTIDLTKQGDSAIASQDVAGGDKFPWGLAAEKIRIESLMLLVSV